MTAKEFRKILKDELKNFATKDDFKKLDRRLSNLTTEVVALKYRVGTLEETVQEHTGKIDRMLTSLDSVAHLAQNNHEEIVITGHRLKNIEEKVGINY